MSADLAGLARNVRAKIRLDGDHWVWTGAMARSCPMYAGGSVKQMAWQEVTGEVLHPGELVVRDCHSPRCVNPDHHHIGTLAEAGALGSKRRWTA